jgi:DNA segregation ATPase FtsK/SpoIIIE-like protein
MATRTRRGPDYALRLTSGWQDGLQAALAAYGAQTRLAAKMGAAFFNPGRLDREQGRQTVERIAESGRAVLSAQAAVAGEWLRSPFWVHGVASPADLQASYVRLVEANQELAGAYLDALLTWQRAALAATEDATETVREAVGAQTQVARRVADDVREVQEAAVGASRSAANAARETAERVVDEARAVAEEAAERAEREREELEQERRKAERARERQRAERERAELASRVIKGKINRDDEKIYHLPGQAGYDRLEADQTFTNEEEAQAAGFRRSQAPGGGTIKGNVNREGEKIYHLPGQANYDRVEAEMLFATEEQAQANGFRPAQR